MNYLVAMSQPDVFINVGKLLQNYIMLFNLQKQSIIIKI